MSVSTVMEKTSPTLVSKLSSGSMQRPIVVKDKPETVRIHRNREQLKLGVLENLVGYQLRRAQHNLFQSFNKHLEYAKITPGQIALLIKIQNNAGISQTALARANGIERSTLGEIIDRFEKRQLVDRRKHVSDRRAYALHLSPQGESLLEEIVPIFLQQELNLLDNWDEDEKQTLLRLLCKLADNNN